MEAIENRKLFLRLTPKEIWMVVLLTLAIGAVGWLLPGRFDIVVSDSLDHRIFFLCEPPTMFDTGDYLVFRAKEIKFLQKSLTRKDLFTKQVGCKPGDLLTKEGSVATEGLSVRPLKRIAKGIGSLSSGSTGLFRRAVILRLAPIPGVLIVST